MARSKGGLRVVTRLKRFITGALGKYRRVPRVIEPYAGLASDNRVILRGRVLSRLRRPTSRPAQSRMVNLAQMISLFLTHEVAQVTVEAEGMKAQSDDEGYFVLDLPRAGRVAGWHDIPVSIAGRPGATFNCPVLVPRADARRIIISDIDDTILRTGAHSLARNLWTSLTGNAKTRELFPDALSLLDKLGEDGRNPLCFVSSSPWNFHYFLQSVFDHAGLPPAPMFLRDLGINEKQIIAGSHDSHKSAAIDTILAKLPDLPAVLVGDTGQKDAEIYRLAAQRHPGRIEAVYLRRAVRPGPGTESAIARLEASGDVPLVRVLDRLDAE